MADAGWILGIVCQRQLVEPNNVERVLFCSKVLLNSDEPDNIYEGAGILQAMTNSNEDPIIAAVC